MSSLHVLSAKGTQHEARSAAFPAPSNGLKDVRSSMQSSPSKRIQAGSSDCKSAKLEALDFPTVETCVGRTPLVKLQRMCGHPSNVVLCKLEGDNPAGSVKDRPALSMIQEAERKGLIKPGATLIEATSGNTGIALAMAAAIKGYEMILIMPSNMSEERRTSMAAYGAKLLSVPPGEMETARDLAQQMQREGKGIVLDQFGNTDNPLAHYTGTGPELWEQTQGTITHFVSSMGTTGTIMGASKYLNEKNPDIKIIGLQPGEGAKIPGIRRWSKEYLPSFFDSHALDSVIDISTREAEETTRGLARIEGIFCGVSSGGAVSAALRVSAEVRNSVIVCIICDRGDRYLSTGVFGESAMAKDPQPCTVDEYPSAIACLQGLPQPTYILFTADVDESNQPWCKDCARVLPIVQQAVKKSGGSLLEVRVGPKHVWKDMSHPLRMREDLQLTCIPTLLHWSNGLAVNRIDEAIEAANDPGDSQQLVDQFMEQSRLQLVQ